jgi:cytochrome c biogenesis protein CcmG/thiol:disulfide interchange protein DsbE
LPRRFPFSGSGWCTGPAGRVMAAPGSPAVGRWLAALGLLLLFARPALPEKARAVPRPAPGFRLPMSAGTVSLDSLRGRVVYVDFWASWCEPCRRSFPWLKTMNDRYQEKGLTIVAINLDKDRQAAESFLLKYPAPFRVAFDPSGKTAEAFRVSAMPSSYLIDRKGTIVYAHAGFDSRKTAAIETLIRGACLQ